VQERRFIIPVKTSKNDEALFYNYRTFDFAPSDESTKELDERINAIFIRALTEKGLTYDPVDPDFIIQTYYSYEGNPLYKPESATRGVTSRYGVLTHEATGRCGCRFMTLPKR